MATWRCFAPAKLNLYLHITGRRGDGLHGLDSLVGFATVGDIVTVAPADITTLTIAGPFAAALDGDPRDNLVWRAAAVLARRLGGARAAAIHLDKKLPVASGIGGGSSDAAACLRALAALWHCDDRDLLRDIAASLGSDVPACLAARPAWLGGIGDELDIAGELPPCGVLLVNPGIALPTASVYRAFAGSFSRSARFPIPTDAGAFADMLATRQNDLMDPAIRSVPAIGAMLDRLARFDDSLLARMSGSGATCFALFATPKHAQGAARQLRYERSDWWIAAAALATGEADFSAVSESPA